MQIILFDDRQYADMYPFTFTRAAADIRVGILTIREKWGVLLKETPFIQTRDYLSALYKRSENVPSLYINGALLPDEELLARASQLKPGEQLLKDKRLLMACMNSPLDLSNLPDLVPGFKTFNYEGTPSLISYPWNIFTLNDQEIRKDFKLLTKGRKSSPVSVTNQVMNAQDVFIEEGAIVECSIINASSGPVYIDKKAEVMEGCIIRGPFSLGEQAVLKMGSRIYGATTIGPGAKVGGEVSNSVIFGNSNKAHDGFLGNSVIGEWCNLGADTNNSNLKNNYGDVSVWNYPAKDYIKTGLQFCGLFMGDHSKCGINTMFNTGTVTGVSANIFGAGFPEKYIPSFTWGGTDESEVFLLDKALELAGKVMERRGKKLDDVQKNILTHLFMEHLKPLPGSGD
jgi:UDP-N-acetylglucosamine diphosphorylase/glucosamine-1-phosphate N-acetyltransferase